MRKLEIVLIIGLFVAMSGMAEAVSFSSATQITFDLDMTGDASLDGAVTVNDSSADADFRVESNGDQNAIFVDAGNDRVGIFTAAPSVPFEVTGNTVIEGSVVINESSADLDTRIESNGNANAIFVDAGNDRVGIFTAAPSVPFEITGNTVIEGSVVINESSADLDFRVESDNVAAALQVDAGDDFVSIGGGLRMPYTNVNAASYTITASDKILGTSYTGTAATSVVLSSAGTADGRIIIIQDTGGNANANNVTVGTEGAETIDGAATASISADYGALRLFSDGSNWFSF